MPYQMPNGKWRAKRMIHGIVRTKSFPTKQEAKKWEAAQEAATWESESQTTVTACFLDFANAYLDMAQDRFSRPTLTEKKLAFRYLFKTVSPSIRPEEVTPAMALQALRLVVSQSSGHAANKARKNLIAAWAWGKKYYGLPLINPFAEVDKFPADEKPRYVPSEKDFWKAYDAASPHDQVFLLTMLHTGGRRMEIFRMKWEDVNMEERKIRLGTRKTTHGGMEYAWVPMTSQLHAALVGHKQRSRSEYVFVDPATGYPYTSRQHYMKMLCERAGVKPFGFHAIRHLAATILAYGGMDIPSVQGVLRHKSPNTTARYIKSLCVQTEKLDRIFENRRPTAKILPFAAGH